MTILCLFLCGLVYYLFRQLSCVNAYGDSFLFEMKFEQR